MGKGGREERVKKRKSKRKPTSIAVYGKHGRMEAEKTKITSDKRLSTVWKIVKERTRETYRKFTCPSCSSTGCSFCEHFLYYF